MRNVDYEDSKGRWSVRQMPDDAPPENARYGIVVGPPDLSGLQLPEEVETRLNNELYHRGLITSADLRGRNNELQAALQAALRVDFQLLHAAYQGVEVTPNG